MRHYQVYAFGLLFFLLSIVSFSESVVADSTTKSFNVPDTKGQITFWDPEISYETSSLNNNIWFFKALGYQHSKGDFSVSASGSKILITHYNPMSQESNPETVMYTGYVRYTVEGVGEQTFNMHFLWDLPVHWKVTIDDIERSEGDGWTFSDGWLTVRGATYKVAAICYVDPPQAQYPVPDSQVCFPLPELNCNIKFASTISFREPNTFDPNRTTYVQPKSSPYPYAILFKTKQPNLQNLPQTPWWLFDGIVAEDKSMQGIGSLAVTAKNSNVTFTALGTEQYRLPGQGKDANVRIEQWLNFSVSGVGEQSVGLFSGIGTHVNMTVNIDSVQRERGNGWVIAEDGQGNGWLTVTNAKSTVSIHTSDIPYAGPMLIFEPDYLLIGMVGIAFIACIFTVIFFVVKKRKKTRTADKK